MAYGVTPKRDEKPKIDARIRELWEKGLTVTQIAARMGIGASSVSRVVKPLRAEKDKLRTGYYREGE